MAENPYQFSKRRMYAAFAGTILVAVCCFTPILVILLGAVGLSAFTPYLDWVLLPALVVMVILAAASCLRWRRLAGEENTDG
jgi:mercuric ion transport protein